MNHFLVAGERPDDTPPYCFDRLSGNLPSTGTEQANEDKAPQARQALCRAVVEEDGALQGNANRGHLKLVLSVNDRHGH